MALVDCLKKNSKNFSSIEQEKLIERSNELQEQGMSQQEADRFVIDEIADEMRTKFNNIKKQIKLPLDAAPKDDFSEIEKAINESSSKYNMDIYDIGIHMIEQPTFKPKPEDMLKAAMSDDLANLDPVGSC